MSSDISLPSEAFLALGVVPSIAKALVARGFTTPTPVQTALANPALAGRDVLVSSQTGSGKTVAFGFLLAGLTVSTERARNGVCSPQAIVIAPTRELALQVREELAWLLAAIGARVIAVTGGTSVVGDLRALASGSEVVVGTPGRLNDHLTRGSIAPANVTTVVLDEADEMLDMGFRDELEAILNVLPKERRTVMLSATLPGAIVAMARRFQRDPVRIAIDPPGASNENIAHVAHLVPPQNKVDALVNILLGAPEERTLVFVRTRAEAAEIGASLADLGFAAAPLTGEMAQRERTQTLDAFRSGRITVLIATDVAARGIDVPEVVTVVHVDLPGDASSLTHRAGRTGRAGRKGTSVLLVPPFARGRASELLRAAGVRANWCSVPSYKEIIAVAETRLRTKLVAPTDSTGAPVEPLARNRTLATALLAESDPVDLIARLLGEFRWEGPCAVRNIQTPQPQNGAKREFNRGGSNNDFPRPARDGGDSRHEFPRGGRDGGGDSHVMFRTNFGERQGATPARLLAMVCRRGGVRGNDVGAISIGAGGSTFGVSRSVASSFADSASRADVREPHLRIERVAGGGDGDRPSYNSDRPSFSDRPASHDRPVNNDRPVASEAAPRPRKYESPERYAPSAPRKVKSRTIRPA